MAAAEKTTRPQSAESTPCWDAGYFVKALLNPTMRFRTNKKKARDNVPIYIVGSEVYNGVNAEEVAREETKKLLYFSYRNRFPPLPNGGTTDSHWGCLIRTGQMLMAAAMMRFHNAGDRLFCAVDLPRLRSETQPLFMDTSRAPFSVHQLEYEAHKIGVDYATWLSPTQAGKSLAAASLLYRVRGGQAPTALCLDDRNVNKSLVFESLGESQPVLLLIPVAMGVKKLNERYENIMLRFLDMDSCCGIAGGKGRMSLYILGYQGDEVFMLDPHYVQSAYLSEKTAGKTSMPRVVMKASKVDPCMLLGFYIRDSNAFEVFLEELSSINSMVPFPLISISERDPAVERAERASAAHNSNRDTEADILQSISSTAEDHYADSEHEHEGENIDNPLAV